MKTHRELLDNYYEASWALAMEQVAIRQGEEAKELQEQLDQDPEAEVPQHTVRRCRAAIRKAFTPSAGRRVRRVLAKVLVAAVLCAAMTTAACAISPQFRAFLSEIFSQVAQTFTAITFRDPEEEVIGGIEEEQPATYQGLRFEWLPEGYEYVAGQNTEKLQRVDFVNGQSETIRVRVMDADGATAYTYDSETGTVTHVKIGEFNGWVVIKGKYSAAIWVDEVRGKSISIIASELTQESLLQLARGLRY